LIRFFRANDPYRLVFVFLVLVAARLFYSLWGMPLSMHEFKNLLLGEWLSSGFYMYSQTFDDTAPLAAWTYELLDYLFGRSRAAHWVFSTLLIYIQAAYFNRTVIRNKVFREPNYVVAFIYVLLSFATIDFFALSPQLMSLTWVVVAIDHLVRRLDNEASDSLFLFPGFYLGLAGLFYMPSLAFFVIFLLAMVLIIRAKTRRIILFVYGLLASFLIVIFFLYLQGGLQEFWRVYFDELFRSRDYRIGLWNLLIWVSLTILMFFIGLVQSYRNSQSNLFSRTQQFMLLVLLAVVVVMLTGSNLAGPQLVFLIPCFAFFITDYFINLRRRFWRWLLPHLVIVSLLMVPYLSLTYGQWTDRTYATTSAAPATDEKVMVIGAVGKEYLEGRMASPCFDARITDRRLGDLDYYNRATVWLEIFSRAQPDRVIDRKNIMEKMEYRFPEIKEQDYVKISN